MKMHDSLISFPYVVTKKVVASAKDADFFNHPMFLSECL